MRASALRLSNVQPIGYVVVMLTINAVRQSTPRLRPPPGACDCHAHVFGPAARFPYDPDRAYTPADASLDDLNRLHAHLGIDRVVIVHPSPYGADNRIGIDALSRLGRDRARGVAVIAATTTDAELAALAAVGTCAARVNLSTAGVADPTLAWHHLEATARRIAPLGWHLQTFAPIAVLAALAPRLATLPVTVVIDHFGLPDAGKGTTQPGFDAILRLLSTGNVYVKVSASYRISARSDHADVAPLARALIAENPDRIVWGTDWPHPGGARRADSTVDAIEPFIAVDDGAALDRLADWAPDAATLARILVANPARLYGFR